MLPPEIRALILEYHEPKCLTNHDHGGMYCLICWRYDPDALLGN